MIYHSTKTCSGCTLCSVIVIQAGVSNVSDLATGTVCMNIGRGQRRLRYISAVGFAIALIVVYVLLIALGVSRWWRLVLALPIWLGGFSFLEAYHKTCVQLAAHNEQSLDDSLVISKTLRGDKVQDENMKRALREKARK